MWKIWPSKNHLPISQINSLVLVNQLNNHRLKKKKAFAPLGLSFITHKGKEKTSFSLLHCYTFSNCHVYISYSFKKKKLPFDTYKINIIIFLRNPNDTRITIQTDHYYIKILRSWDIWLYDTAFVDVGHKQECVSLWMPIFRYLPSLY